MLALSRGATRRFATHCSYHDRVGADECVLFDALCLVQECQSQKAFLLLWGMAADGAARTALSSAQGLGTELALAGCDLLEPDAAGAPFEVDGGPTTVAGTCAATLH